MTSFFSGHILGPHRGTVPFSKHHEQRAEERVRERESAQFAVDQHSAQAARFTASPVCWQWQIFCCSWGPTSFCPACFTWTPAHCFWTLTEVTGTEYTFSQSIGLLQTQGDSLCWGEKWGWTEGEKGWKQSRKELTRKMTCVRVKVYHQREASTLKIWWKHNQGFYHRWLSPKRFWFKIPICIWIALNRHFNGGGGDMASLIMEAQILHPFPFCTTQCNPMTRTLFFLVKVNLHLQQLKRSARHYTICCYSSSYLTAVSLCIYLSSDVLTRKKKLSNG